MSRCAVYVRVSTDNEEQENSLKYQKEYFINFIKEKGWTLHDLYIDVQTGTKDRKRPELKRLIDDAENSKFDVILAKELSRLARNSELSHKIKRIAEDSEIDIITLDNAINTMEGNNQLFGLYSWLYEQESQRTSERIKISFRAKAKKGLLTGGHAPYGYSLKDGKLYIRDDDTPNIVNRIFDEYIKGIGQDTIARKLYEEGVPTPSMVANKKNQSDKWHGSSIRLILSNETYIGNLIQCKETSTSVTSTKRRKVKEENIVRVENCHEAIIDKERFNTVQKLLVERSVKKAHQKVHLFTSILFCADCGKGMHFKKNRKGYVCGSFNHHGKKACSDHIVRESALTSSILSDLRHFISALKDESVFNNFESTIDKYIKSHEKAIKYSLNKLDNATNKKLKAIDSFLEGALSKSDYNLITIKLDNDINLLKKQIEEHESLLNNLNKDSILDEINQVRSEVINLNELTPEILHRFISKIEIKKNGDARIFYRFSHLPFNF